MGGIHFSLIVAIAIIGLGFWLLSRSASQWARVMLYRWGSGGVGAILILESLFFENWMKLVFPKYIFEMPHIIGYYIPAPLADFLFKKYGLELVGKSLEFLYGINLNGVMVHTVFTLKASTHIFCLLPGVLAAFTLIGIFFSSNWPGAILFKVLGGVLAGLSIIALVGLVASLGDLAALGMESSFQGRLIAAVLNARLGNGPWFTTIGLLFLLASGIVEITAKKNAGEEFASAADPFDLPVSQE